MRSPLSLFTVEDYIIAEAESTIRHEYMGGYVFAMAGASEEHNLIAGNLYALLRSHLRGSSCRVFMSDMKVKVQDDIFYYPDLLVTCNPEDNHRYFKTQPNLIIEVLSESTESTDRREKLMNYQTLETLKEYVLVSQDVMQVEVYRQDTPGSWTVQILGEDNQLTLESVGLTMTVAQIYEDVLNVGQ
ncbi:MAG: Uma2 family endonuclease [Limnospira sp. PMC 1291.21]|uniref:Uma2 family endonuclease n=2 Tax=Limnospira TaxID=2596745 RepID=A0ABU9EMF5_LIMFS|nr:MULTISPECIES: Uma2 family endonuclease [Limnospira]QJB24714.1 Uma2 family endonuclease [Limnospira fusiformis SAG 85.79]UWU46312.1 Endonuclease, Uma2 family (restriction endonuclease fold) [Arthrospira platensis C1]MDT9180770.1 Uma2 family endonuclease [Limnospira sp. PMC 1238.20]MDT9196087.1 Uma2 family endonuclease [Limnospira sp. PMC 1245.20]MDT9206357.1 Uma2 family endonuclease [Limnospira sp. PMC 1243.20]